MAQCACFVIVAVIDEMLTGCSSTLPEVSVSRDTSELGGYPRKHGPLEKDRLDSLRWRD